ncbi:MAG: hypothetical protein AAFN00_16975 [Cyanobacteria bacterium J06558_2]
MNKKINIVTSDSKLDIKIAHYGLSGKFKGGTLKLIYILLGIHGFNFLLLFGAPDFLFLTKIYSFLFYLWEASFMYLIVYSYFGFTRVIIDCKDFRIEKGIGKFFREVSGKTANIEKVEVKPTEVFRRQYRNYLFGFSSEKNVTYACYLLPNSEYCFGAMCDRQDLEQIASQINDFLSDRPRGSWSNV